jgi:hypothetical protein
MPVSFASDIRPLFRDSPDVDSMQDTASISCPTKMSRGEHPRYTRVSRPAACRAMSRGLQNALGYSDSGWMRALRYKTGRG